jgi:hypothetical protein
VLMASQEGFWLLLMLFHGSYSTNRTFTREECLHKGGTRLHLLSNSLAVLFYADRTLALSPSTRTTP